MADVKWIKITTDIFDDEKILLIESMPDADAVIVIWFKLLCLAGKQNNSGVFTMHDRIAYTDEMFATIFRKPISTIRMALDVFENFGMIERVNGVVTIPNWGKHQTLDRIEAYNAHKKEYMREYRERQKLKSLTGDFCNGNSNGNSSGNVTEIEEDKEKEIEEELYIPSSYEADAPEKKPVKEKKHKCGAFKHVLLTDTEYEKLFTKFGEPNRQRLIDYLDQAIEEKGYKYKNHYLTITKEDSWVQREVLGTGGKRFDKHADKRGVERGTDYGAIVETPLIRASNASGGDILEELRNM